MATFFHGIALSCTWRYIIAVIAIRTEILPVGPPVQLEWQIGRTRDIEQVRLAAENGEHVVLIDVRRTGKSTVALGAIEQLAHSGALVFVLDASENAPDSTELARRLQHQLAAHRSAKNQLFSTASQAVRVLFDVGVGTLSLVDDAGTRETIARALTTISTAQRSGAQYLDATLREIAEEARRMERPATVLIDEIQAITRLPDASDLEALLRSRLASRESVPTFVFAGSETTAMETLFAQDGMLQFHGIAHHLQAISDGDWSEGLIRAFHALGCNIAADAISELLEESGGQPHRTMLIARETHRIVQTSRTPKDISRGHVVAGVQAAREQKRLWRIGDET